MVRPRRTPSQRVIRLTAQASAPAAETEPVDVEEPVEDGQEHGNPDDSDDQRQRQDRRDEVPGDDDNPDIDDAEGNGRRTPDPPADVTSKRLREAARLATDSRTLVSRSR